MTGHEGCCTAAWYSNADAHGLDVTSHHLPLDQEEDRSAS
jgi:hypothetical protein